MSFRADLHTHSNFSDGTYSPDEMIILAKEANLQGLSITDHDTIGAYTTSFFQKAKEVGLEIVLGVELSSEHIGESVHVLAYGWEKTDRFIQFLEQIQKRRKERNQKIIQKLMDKGFLITEEDLFLSKEEMTNGRLGIASILWKKGYVKSIAEAFSYYLHEAGSCYEKGEKFSTEEVIYEIHEAKGKAILAHPQLIRNYQLEIELLEMPFDGLEGYYAKLFSYREKKWVELGKKKGWIVTGGSDFHGKYRLNIPIGCSWVGKEVFDILWRPIESG
ncbi:MAG: PHP domain-containing protein [Chlamydiota bacterium]